MLERLRFLDRLRSRHATSEREALRLRELELLGQIDAINRVQAVIEFALDGTILNANSNFLKLMGYTLPEVLGRHHSMFVEPEYRKSDAYKTFWAKLRRGEYDRAEYKRVSKGGADVWLLASYNPVFGPDGRLIRIIKFATDVTAEKLRNVEFSGQMAAIHRVQGVIEFGLDGTILTANPVFLDLMGYSIDEIRGRHHSLFVQSGEEHTEEYREFWRHLREGRADARVYKRLGRNGKVVWIQASYNPILDLSGKPFKIVKFASDLTGLINQTESTQHTAENVASATAEMSRSIGEIHHSMEQSRTAAAEIMAASRWSGEQATRLLASMAAMASIVTLVRGIAGRIDLLALNASIEAARAGEAGRGFAVVANEVKLLSNQTSRANEEIGQEISSVQAMSAQVADSIRRSIDGVDLVNEQVRSVSTLLEEQCSAIETISTYSRQMVSAVEAILTVTRRGTKVRRAA